jgi:hypothetical protein
MKKNILLALLIFIVGCSSKQSEERLLVEATRLDSLGQLKMAIRIYDQILASDSTNINALLDRSFDKGALGQRDGQIKDLKRVLVLQPQNTLALFNLGIAYGNINKYVESIDAFKRAVATKGGEMISVDFKKNEFSKSDTYGFDVPIADIKLERGIVYYHTDSLEKAFEDLSFCIKQKYELGESFYYRAATWVKAGNGEQACKDAKMSSIYGMKQATEIIDKYCK